MKIFCWIGWHQFEFLRLEHYYDVSFGTKDKSTMVVHKCKCCNKIKTKFLYGAVLKESDFKHTKE